MSSPFQNFAMAREIMKTDNSLEEMKAANVLMDNDMEQQGKVTSSKKVATKSDACHTTLGSTPKTIYSGSRDNESHTGSTAIQRRNARNGTNTILVDSNTRRDGEPQKSNVGPQPRKSPPRREKSCAPSEHPDRKSVV